MGKEIWFLMYSSSAKMVVQSSLRLNVISGLRSAGFTTVWKDWQAYILSSSLLPCALFHSLLCLLLYAIYHSPFFIGLWEKQELRQLECLQGCSPIWSLYSWTVTPTYVKQNMWAVDAVEDYARLSLKEEASRQAERPFGQQEVFLFGLL